MILTKEQEAVVEAVLKEKTGKVIAVKALAGT